MTILGDHITRNEFFIQTSNICDIFYLHKCVYGSDSKGMMSLDVILLFAYILNFQVFTCTNNKINIDS